MQFQIKTPSNGRWLQNISSRITQKLLVTSIMKFKHKLRTPDGSDKRLWPKKKMFSRYQTYINYKIFQHVAQCSSKLVVTWEDQPKDMPLYPNVIRPRVNTHQLRFQGNPWGNLGCGSAQPSLFLTKITQYKHQN